MPVSRLKANKNYDLRFPEFLISGEGNNSVNKFRQKMVNRLPPFE